MEKNKYYCRINGKIHNLQDIQEALDNKTDINIIVSLVENHGIEDWIEAASIAEIIELNNNQIPADYDEALKRMQDYNQSRHSNSQAVTCPYCNSTNVKKVGTSGRLASVLTLGIASGKMGKQWHCNNCKSNF